MYWINGRNCHYNLYHFKCTVARACGQYYEEISGTYSYTILILIELWWEPFCTNIGFILESKSGKVSPTFSLKASDWQRSFLQSRLQAEFHNNDLDCQYNLPWQWFWLWIVLFTSSGNRAHGRQGMLAPYRHLIPISGMFRGLFL
jgi:hypothetical protein